MADIELCPPLKYPPINLITHNCCFCGKKLTFLEFKQAIIKNNIDFEDGFIYEMWRNPIFIFQCCICFVEGQDFKIEDVWWWSGD